MSEGPVLPTDAAPEPPAHVVEAARPSLLRGEDHDLCPGCGEPLAVRVLLETIEMLACQQRAIAVMGIGCYTALSTLIDVDTVQALHGRAPSLATGVKRMQPDSLVFTLQGDGDMASEGLQEVIHTAARGERVTCVMLNNGVFGETGGHMTATTVLGQRTKNTLEGRNAAYHGHPIGIAEMLAPLGGTAYSARAAVYDARSVTAARRMLRRAFESQLAGEGFSFVEILTMCPTGWFIPTAEGPGYLDSVMGSVHGVGELKVAGKLNTRPEEPGA